MEGLIEIGMVSALVLELIKWLLRLPALFGPSFDFPVKFYAIVIPALNIALLPLMALVGFEGFIMPTDWQAWGLLIIRTLIGSLISLGTYAVTMKPLKSYALSRQVNPVLKKPK